MSHVLDVGFQGQVEAPAGTIAPYCPPAVSIQSISFQPTEPGQRPFVEQVAITTPVNIVANNTEPVGTVQACDGFLINVPSTAANSVFLAYGLATATSHEIRAGIPQFFGPDNTRELWELQRLFEAVATILGNMAHGPTPGPFRAPRAVFDSTKWSLFATANTTVSVTIFLPPPQQ